MSKDGRLSYIKNLVNDTYNERPVSVDVFLSDPYFLGNSTNNGKAVFPAWRRKMREMFNNDSRVVVALTGAIGTGKTDTAIKSMLYVMHKLLCLKDPWGTFGLEAVGKMAVVFFNLTKSLSQSKGYSLLQQYLLQSQWFLDRCRGIRGTKDQYLDFDLFKYVLASPYAKGFGTVGEDVVVGIMDELDSPTESVNQKMRVLKAFEATERRFESRFVKEDVSLGRLFLVSSKQDELSFLNTYIEKKKNNKKIFVIDLPQWEVRTSTSFCGDKFSVMIGDVYHPPKILDDDEKIKQAKIDGFQVIQVPVEYRESFDDDLIGAIRDIAGMSVVGLRKSKLFASERLLIDCYDADKPDPVAMHPIMIGIKDEIDLIKFINLDKIRVDRSVPRCLHCDFAKSHDAYGIAMSCVAGVKEVNIEKEDGTFDTRNMPVVETDFVMRIKAKDGDEIPFNKIRKFILDLRASRFSIREVSADLDQMSADTRQILEKSGIHTSYLSVDKTPVPYTNFKNLVIDGRWVCHRNEYMHFELSNLEFDRDKGKIDHPAEVKDVMIASDGDIREMILEGSKDMADAVCGSVETLLSIQSDFANMPVITRLVKKATGKRNDTTDSAWWVKDKNIIGTKEGDEIRKFTDIVKKSNK